MMLDAVTFDLGGARPPLFVFPDASGLAPLTLPDEFLRGQSHQPQTEFPSDTVRRFETAMSTEQPLPPSIVESLMTSVISGSPKVESQEFESPKVERPTIEGPKIERSTVESPKIERSAVERLTVERPTVERPTVESPTAERPKVESRRPEVASIANPAPVASVERPMTVTVDTVVQGDSVARSADEKPVFASSEHPKMQVFVAPQAEPTIAIVKASAKPAERPTVTTVERPVVVSADKPAVAISDRPMVVSVEAPMVATVEKPVTVASPAVPTVAPVVLENPADSVKAEVHPIAASNTPIIPDAPATRPAAMVEAPVAVDKPIGASVEHSVRAAVGESDLISETVTLPVDSMERSADERPVVASAELPQAPVVAAPGKQAVVIEQTSAKPAERPAVATGEKSVVVSADKPAVAISDRPTVVSVEVPTVAAVEKPVAVVPSPAPTVAPVVLENPDDPVKAEEHPVAASNTPIIPDAPATRPAAMVEAPVAVDKPIGASVERSVSVAVEEPVVASVPPKISEGFVARSADERPIVATVERPVVVAPDTPTIVTVERSVVVTPDKPVVVTVERPVVVATPVAPSVAPVVLENPDDPVKAEGHPVVVSGTPIIPDAPATRPDVMVEAPVAVDKPIGASVERSVSVAVEELVVASVNKTIPEGSVVRTADEKPVVSSPEQPKAPMIVASEKQSVVIGQTPVKPVEKPEEKAVAAAAHVVVAPAAVEVPTPQALQAAPEVAAASAASARTEVIVETVNQIVEAVVRQILVTPGITQGECEIKIMLKPTVLDGSEITMSAKDGTLTVGITPATQEASAAAAAALPRLEIALAEHAPAFHHVSVALQLKKGNRNEAV